jgi:hemoglobin/transferrin/lactoferrin receptor protein
MLFAVLSLKSQQLTVFDAETGKPLQGVLVYSESFSTQTDSLGKANVDLFKPEETIHFKHSSYLTYKTNRSELTSQGNIVLLIEDPIRLDEIIVSVSRREQARTEIPNKVLTLGIEDVYMLNPQTSADLLGSKGGIFIQKSQMGGGSPMIRGFSANRVLIVVDGVRMNNAIFRSGNLHNVISLDANATEHTEIIFGPGSVMYGSDAMGGVMGFHTLTPKLTTLEENDLSTHLLARYSTANREKTIHTHFNYGSKKLALLGSITYSDFNDLKMGSHGPVDYLRPEYVADTRFETTDHVMKNDNPEIQRYTGYTQLNLMAKARYRPDHSFELTFGSHYSASSDIPRYDRLIVYSGEKLKYGEWYYGPQVWAMQNLNIQWRKETFLFDRMTLIAAFQYFEESRNDRKLDDPERQRRVEKLHVASFNLDFDKQFNTHNLIYYGMECYLNTLHSTGETIHLPDDSSVPAASRYPDDSRYRSYAGYLTYKRQCGKKVTLQSGLRYTLTHAKGIFSNDFYDFPFSGFNTTNSAVNGNIGLVWRPSELWQVNGMITTGFRSPNIDDIAKVFDSEPGNVVVPNPGLKPEYARGCEVSLIRNCLHKARFELNGFYTHLKNAMVRRDFPLGGADSIFYDGELSKVEALINAESAHIYGGSFTFEYILNRFLRTRHMITVTKGEDAEHKPVRHVAPTFGNSHLIFRNRSWTIDLYTDYSGKIDYHNLAESERDKPYLYVPDEQGNPTSPGWWTLNIKSSYKVNQHLRFSGGIENILDKRYRPYSSGVVAPGINLLFSVLSDF